jgi:hypothetical protein
MSIDWLTDASGGTGTYHLTLTVPGSPTCNSMYDVTITR